MENVNLKNWQTTVVGFLTGIGMCVVQLINLLDKDPETVFQLAVFMAGLGAMGLGYFAKDGNKSSKKLGLPTLLLAVILLGLAGCSQVKYGGAEWTQLGDVNADGGYVENIIGPATITIDPNTGLQTYKIEPNGVYTLFRFDSWESEGKSPPVETIAETVGDVVNPVGGLID